MRKQKTPTLLSSQISQSIWIKVTVLPRPVVLCLSGPLISNVLETVSDTAGSLELVCSRMVFSDMVCYQLVFALPSCIPCNFQASGSRTVFGVLRLVARRLTFSFVEFRHSEIAYNDCSFPATPATHYHSASHFLLFLTVELWTLY